MARREPMWRRYARFFGPNVEADVDDELADHLARLEEELRARGVGEAEIAAAVRTRFGDSDAIRARLRRSDELRQRRRLTVEAFGSLGQDVAYALRRLGKRPGFTAAVVVVLALGVGATTAMFSAVDAAMLRPLPFPQADRLMVLRSISMPSDFGPSSPRSKFNYPELDDVARMSDTFTDVAAYAVGSVNLSDPQRPVRVRAGVVTSGFFRTIGIPPRRGRAFSATEGKPGGPAVVVLSDALWRGHYGARPLLDSTISVSGTLRRVIGIMPPNFDFPGRSDLWIPLTDPVTFDTYKPFRSFLPSLTLARLAPGVTAASADRRVRMLWTRTAAAAASVDARSTPMFRDAIAGLDTTGFTALLQPSLVGDRRTALLVLLGATGLLLLIACANVTNLLLSQAAIRRPEIALRSMLGATRRRIVRQLLTESVILAATGTVAGVALAPLTLRALAGVLPSALAAVASPKIDGRVLAFAVVLALASGVGFGLWPAWGASRADLATGARSSGRSTTPGGAAGAGRRALLTAELALTALLLVGAGLALRSFARLTGVDSGVAPDHVATLELHFGGDAGTTADQRARLAAIVGRIESSPGMEAAGIVNVLPLGGEGGISISVYPEGDSLLPPGQQKRAYYLIASGGYFRAMGIPILLGRTFTPADDSGAPRVALINRAMAQGMWPGQDPIGRRFIFVDQKPITVVGEVGDVRISGLEAPATYQMYFPIDQQNTSYMSIVARGTLPRGGMLTRLRDAVHAVDPSQAVYSVRMMDDVVSASVAPQRTDTLLISLFGVLALVLSALGVYAVVSYSVAQRRRELGIRAALGASGRDLLSLVAREMVWVTLLGLALGLAGAWAGARVLQSLLYGVGVHDVATFAVAPLALLVPVALATLIPARRAARTNPVEIIREE